VLVDVDLAPKLMHKPRVKYLSAHWALVVDVRPLGDAGKAKDVIAGHHGRLFKVVEANGAVSVHKHLALALYGPKKFIGNHALRRHCGRLAICKPIWGHGASCL
jgi:hypothetical protein